MPLFRRQEPPSRPRSSQEREYARQERVARRQGLASPPSPWSGEGLSRGFQEPDEEPEPAAGRFEPRGVEGEAPETEGLGVEPPAGLEQEALAPEAERFGPDPARVEPEPAAVSEPEPEGSGPDPARVEPEPEPAAVSELEPEQASLSEPEPPSADVAPPVEPPEVEPHATAVHSEPVTEHDLDEDLTPAAAGQVEWDDDEPTLPPRRAVASSRGLPPFPSGRPVGAAARPSEQGGLLARLFNRAPREPASPVRRASPPLPPRSRAGQPPRFPARPGAAAAPPPGPRRRRTGLALAGVVALIAVAVVLYLADRVFQPFAGDGSGRVVVTIPRGTSAADIGTLLADRGVVDSAFFFSLRARIDGKRGDFKSGTFPLRRDMSYAAAIQALTTAPPPPPVIRVTIPEGPSRREVAPLLRRAGVTGDYLAATRASSQLDPRRYGAPTTSLEGFLFPATYELARGHATAQRLVAEQLAAFRTNFARVSLAYARSKHLTPYDVLTIASMVEREAAVPRDRRLIAAVIYNRLRLGMTLGIDATLRYALHDWTSPLTLSQLRDPTPYNTRLHTGLPPTPIGNPGLASIEAAASPARVPYLYFVVRPGTCGHVFETNYAQFLRDSARYQSARSANGGRSPTTC